MSSTILNLGNYLQLIRISRNDRGEDVDWIGYFGFLGGSVAEGFAFEVASVNGSEILRPVREGYCVRLYTNRIAYSPLGLVYWKRPGDSFECSSEAIQIPCIRLDRITHEHLFSDPEYRTVQRTIVTLRPVPADLRTTVNGCELAIGLEYPDE